MKTNYSLLPFEPPIGKLVVEKTNESGLNALVVGKKIVNRDVIGLLL